MENKDNMAMISGVLTELSMDHEVLGESFYTGTLECRRLSGIYDRIPVTISERLLSQEKPDDIIGPISLKGQVRSYNKLVDGAARHCMTLFVQDFEVLEMVDPQNDVAIEGTVCKQPNFRITPFGREICDLMIAVNRAHSKSDYIPCIAWGRNGRWAASLSVGDRVVITGRLQSREYEKLLDDGRSEKRTVNEVSVFGINRAPEEAKAPA